MQHKSFASLCLGMLLVACEPPNEPELPRLESITVTAAASALMVNETTQLTAAGQDQNGDPFSISDVVWSSGDIAKAEVSTSGQVSARGAGTVTISATSGGKTGTLQVTVAGTLHANRTIAASETWTAVNNPHVVRGALYVQGTGTPTLTVQSGVQIRFDAGAELLVGWGGPGSIQVLGTAAAPVTFTSSAGSPAAGQWKALTLSGEASNSRIEHAVFEYCGGQAFYGNACIHMVGQGPGYAVPVIGVTVRHSSGRGIQANNTARFGTGSTNLTVTSAASHPVVVDADYAGTLPSGSTYTSNGNNTILLTGGDVSITQAWANHAVPYLVNNEVRIEGSGSPVLSIPAGTTLRFGQDGFLSVGWGGSGALSVTGTAASPVVFTADAATPTAGHWTGIVFSGLTNGGASGIAHATIEYCGRTGFYGNACLNLQADGSSGFAVPVSNVMVRHGSGRGIQVNNSGRFGAGSANVSVQNVASYPFTIQPNHASSLPVGGTFTNNTVNAVFLHSGGVSTSQTWPNIGIPYVADHEIRIEAVSSPVLTLRPGTELRFTTNGAITTGWGGAGGLDARGKADSLIVFTANAAAPSPGHWPGITLSDQNTGTLLDYVVIEYGGRTAFYGNANIHLAEDFGAILTNSTIRHSSACGVHRYQFASPAWTTDYTAAPHNNTFTSNGTANQCGP